MTQAHHPDLDSWRCKAWDCGAEWPCTTERTRLLVLWPPAELVALMLPFRDLAAESEALREVPWRVLDARFVGWVRQA